MDATCAIQESIHVFSLVRKYVSRILGTYQFRLSVNLVNYIADILLRINFINLNVIILFYSY